MTQSYPTPIVGERSYQQAIRGCRPGQSVTIVREIGNPYDANALAVVSKSNRTIGYLPKSGWLYQAINDDGKGCDCAIMSVGQGDAGIWGVVLSASPNNNGIGERHYGDAEGGGFLARLLGR